MSNVRINDLNTIDRSNSASFYVYRVLATAGKLKAVGLLAL